MSGVLGELVAYYQACLQEERRETLSVLEARLEQSLLPLGAWAEHSWHELSQHPAVQQLVATLRGRVTPTLAYAPYVLTTARGTRHEPLVGVYATVQRGRLTVDPGDLWLSDTLTQEMDEESLLDVRDALERAARASPRAFREAIDALIQREALPNPQLCPDIDTLRRVPEGTISDFPALWIVPVEAQYDRGLSRELKTLHEMLQWNMPPSSLGALDYLEIPPRTEPLTLEELLIAYANPVRPTFSQALAIAHALKQRITVITGPPGTGKTRIIAGLVLEQLLCRKSVLVASRINTAVDTAVSMVERLIGRGAILRTGNQEARAELSALASEIAGWRTFEGAGSLWREVRETPETVALQQAQRAVRMFYRAVRQLQSTAERVAHSATRSLRWWQLLQRWRIARYERAWQTLHHAAQTLMDAVEQLRWQKLLELRARLDALIAAAAPHMPQLCRALDSESRARHRAFRKLAQLGYPIALSSLTVSTNLPLERELFDLLIIDEASTCDPASLLPLLYRARRAVIIGDPQQLPHVTGRRWQMVTPVPVLEDVAKREFRAEFGISAYELTQTLVGGEAHAMLTDHFRCPPQIISFANARFYGGNLRIHTPLAPNAVELRLVQGRHTSTHTGSRLNSAQQEAALQAIRECIANAPHASFGIVVPYRAAADALIRLAQADPLLSPLLGEEQLLIGTAHRFQGNEVDYLVFATIVGANATERDLRWVEQPNLFNVAITRARQKLIVLADPELWHRGRLSLTRQLLNTEVVMIDPTPAPKSKVLRDISEFLEAHAVRHHLQAVYRGYHLDVLDAAEPPRWAFNLLEAHTLSQLEPIEALGEWMEARALEQHGVRLRWLEPRTWRHHLARWIAEQELQRGSVAHALHTLAPDDER
ncbi:MAG: DEAD/DEAH box helicase [Armatimonadota bacterium]|nr:DEAD/DEAH box helicase [Armatimonadota bacterium]